MLSDLLCLEKYFDRVSAVFSIDELIKHYDAQTIDDAISKGYLQTKTMCLSDLTKPCMCWLSEKGRCIALDGKN